MLSGAEVAALELWLYGSPMPHDLVQAVGLYGYGFCHWAGVRCVRDPRFDEAASR